MPGRHSGIACGRRLLVGLIGATAGVGLSVSQSLAAAPSTTAKSGAYGVCSLMVEEAWKQAPLTDFDPDDMTRPLQPPPASQDARIVLCFRDSIVPAAHDYRILTEMGLPLFLKVGKRVAQIDTGPGRLHFDMQQGAPPSPREDQAVQARIAQLNVNYAAVLRGNPSVPGVDLTTAYKTDDLELFEKAIGGMRIEAAMDANFTPIKAQIDFRPCPTGADAALTRAIGSYLADERAQLVADMASGFDPPFARAEIVDIGRYLALTETHFPGAVEPASGKPRTAREKAEIETLSKSPAVLRFLASFGQAMVVPLEHLSENVTSALHQVCPALSEAAIASPTLLFETPGPGYPGR